MIATMVTGGRRFGEALRRRRVSAGWTQARTVAELAERGFPYTAQAVSLWEQGHNAPPADVVRSLEEMFGCDGEFSGLLGFAVGPTVDERLTELEAGMDAVNARLDEIAAALRRVEQATRRPPRQRP